MILAKVISHIPSIKCQIGDIIANMHSLEDNQQNHVVPYQESNPYSNIGSPYPNYNNYNSPIHYLF
jgi:hypothetical protein